MDAAVVGAWFTGLATLVAAVGVVLKIVLTRPARPVAEEVMDQLHELQDTVLGLFGWAHQVHAAAALQGFDVPPIPAHLVQRQRNLGAALGRPVPPPNTTEKANP